MEFLVSSRNFAKSCALVAALCPLLAAAQDAHVEPVAAIKEAVEQVELKAPQVVPPALEPVPASAPSAPEFDEDKVAEEIDRLNLERQLLAARASLAKEKLAAEQLARREALDREELEMEERKHRLELELQELRDETARLKAQKDAAAGRADLKLGDLRLAESEMKSKLSTLTLDIAAQEKELAAKLYTDHAPKYLDNPLQGDALVVSDRRIALNGVITARTATDISARIQYYNNQDAKKPIFIVIDDSPGGSVMAGYHILKAMEGSDAPVYVVVKQFAASMAACITTLADRSFAYPNAILLHHQISSGIRGNLTQQREGLAEVEEWWRRLADPVAKKMGISTDDFIKQMYDKVSTGDWTEFADSAKELKWVDHVVNEIRETGQQKHPDAPKSVASSSVRTLIPTRSLEANADAANTGIDAEGRPYALLPRPNPIDKFYLHNPDGYFRFR